MDYGLKVAGAIGRCVWAVGLSVAAIDYTNILAIYARNSLVLVCGSECGVAGDG